jgi:hypothetical protein
MVFGFINCVDISGVGAIYVVPVWVLVLHRLLVAGTLTTGLFWFALCWIVWKLQGLFLDNCKMMAF